jgi:hypothetical protein
MLFKQPNTKPIPTGTILIPTDMTRMDNLLPIIIINNRILVRNAVWLVVGHFAVCAACFDIYARLLQFYQGFVVDY